MKIYNNNVNQVLSLYKDNLSIDKASETTKDKKDEVQISQAAKDFSRYIEHCMNLELSNEKVESIKKSIMDNSYKIDNVKLSNGIMDEINGSGDK